MNNLKSNPDVYKRQGYGCSSDAYHITSPAEDGSGAARAMLNAVQDAGIAVDEVGYILSLIHIYGQVVDFR